MTEKELREKLQAQVDEIAEELDDFNWNFERTQNWIEQNVLEVEEYNPELEEFDGACLWLTYGGPSVYVDLSNKCHNWVVGEWGDIRCEAKFANYELWEYLEEIS